MTLWMRQWAPSVRHCPLRRGLPRHEPLPLSEQNLTKPTTLGYPEQNLTKPTTLGYPPLRSMPHGPSPPAPSKRHAAPRLTAYRRATEGVHEGMVAPRPTRALLLPLPPPSSPLPLPAPLPPRWWPLPTLALCRSPRPLGFDAELSRPWSLQEWRSILRGWPSFLQLHRPHLSRPQLHRPHLSRPQLHRPHLSRPQPRPSPPPQPVRRHQTSSDVIRGHQRA